MKNLFKKVEKGVCGVVADTYNAGSSVVNKVADIIAENDLEAKVKKLMEVNFEEDNEVDCIALIKEIKNLAMEKDLDSYYNQVGTEVKTATIKKGVSSSEITRSVGVIKGMNREYRQWADGDAEKIYEVLKKHAMKNSDGKISPKNIRELESNELVWDFFSMIWEEIQKFFGKKLDEKKVSAGDKYTAGKFAEKVANTSAGQKLGK
jgi:hypothetical protein